MTGTSSGFGKALLNELLSTGHSVVATDRDSAYTDPIRTELAAKYDEEVLKRALVINLDVTKPDQVKAVFAEAVQRFGRIDVVTNNAGYVGEGDVWYYGNCL